MDQDGGCCGCRQLHLRCLLLDDRLQVPANEVDVHDPAGHDGARRRARQLWFYRGSLLQASRLRATPRHLL